MTKPITSVRYETTSIPSLTNPEPITVKGVKISHPALFHIYSGRKEAIPQFVAVAEKRGGTALGAIFKKNTQLNTNKQWMGKVGHINDLLRNEPNSIRTRTKTQMNLDTIREKLASDFFQALGKGLFVVPKTRLSLLPVLNDYNRNDLATYWVQIGINETLRVMSSFLDGYHDFAEAITRDTTNDISFMGYLKTYHRPPESLLTQDGQSVPLQGMIELLAIGRLLADVDLLGGGGCNAGFIWIRNEVQEIIGARVVKIDPGYTFSFTHQDSKNAGRNYVINTAKKLGNFHLQDLKDLQTSTCNSDTFIHWNCLTQAQQNLFLSVLLNTSRYLQSQEILKLFFYREGKFSYPDATHSAVAYMPEELAKQMCNDMQAWLTWQIEIYAEPLDQFKNYLKKKDIALAAVKQDGLALQYVDESLRKDKDIVLAAVREDGNAFEYADESLKKDEAFVLAAVTQDAYAFQYADEILKKDKAFVLAAVTQDAYAFQYADEILKKDKAFVLAVVKQNGLVLQFADESFKKDKAFALAAVTKNGLALKYVDESLIKDKDVVLEAVMQDSGSLVYVDKSFAKDKDVFLAAVTQWGYALQYADESLKKDEDVVLAAVKRNGLALEYADKSLKKDKGIVLAAVKQNGLALQHADESLKKDKDVVLAAVTQDVYAFQFADESLKKDKDVVFLFRKKHAGSTLK
jgi:hypothetical protein